MRKSLIAQSVAVLIGGLVAAGAVNAAVVTTAGPVDNVAAANNLQVNVDGTGHINIVPYYTVQDNNDTYISIVNTDTKNGKAVKVRFRGAANSDDIYDITVLMSPGDHWAAAITRGDNATFNIAKLITTDRTCTLPANVNQNFVTARLDSGTLATAETRANDTREGYVEILNMADIPPTYTPATGPAAGVAGTANPLFTAIKHVNGVPPCGTTTAGGAALDRLIVDSATYADAQSKGLEVPTTGLMSNWTIINVARAAAYSGAAMALEARVGTTLPPQAGFGNIVLFPQSAERVGLAAARGLTSDPLLAPAPPAAVGGVTPPDFTAGFIQAAQFDFPDLSTPYTIAPGGGTTTPQRQAQELTSSLAVTSVSNEYVTEAAVRAKTDWTFSMPTRRYSVAFDYAAGVRRFADISDAAVATDRDYFTTANTSVSGRLICVDGITTAGNFTVSEGPNRNGAFTADREEGVASSPSQFVVSPGSPTAPLTFCGETSVLTFNNPGTTAGTTVLGSTTVRKDLTVPYTNGWVRIATPGLPGPTTTPAASQTNSGLPIIGSSMIELLNNSVSQGFAGGFGLNFPHRVTRVTP